ncbi:MAG: helix-turn-helix domain-containing protein [Actinomycetota bacterium]
MIESVQGPVATDVRHLEADPGSPVDALRHTEHDHLLYWAGSGSIEVRSAELRLAVRRPVTIWVPAGVPHEIAADTTYGIARFDPSTCPDGWRRLARPSLDDTALALLTHLTRFPSGQAAAPVLSAVVEHLVEGFVTAAHPLRLPSDLRARAVAEAILTDPSDLRDLGAWASSVQTSESNLRRLFRTQTGATFTRWRSTARMHEAMRLLETGRPVGQVAALVGYRSAEAFIRAFRSHTGLTPADFGRRFALGAGHPDAPPEVTAMYEEVTPRSIDERQDPLMQLIKQAAQGDIVKLNRPGVLIGAAMLLVAAACSSDDTDSGDGASAPATEATAATTASTMTEPDSSEATEVEAQTEGTDGATRVVTDDEGFEVEIPSEPQRIAIFGERVWTEFAVAFDLPIVGAATQDEFAPYLVEALGDRELADYGAIENFEALAASDPDVIVMDGGEWEENFYALAEEIAPVVRFNLFPLDIFAAIESFGRVFDQERADELSADLQASIDAVSSDLIDPGSIEVSVVAPAGDGMVRLYTDRARLGVQMIDLLGLERPESQSLAASEAAGGGVGEYVVSLEDLELADGDLIIVKTNTGGPDDEAAEPLLTTPLWETLDAVQESDVFYADRRYWNFAGPIAAELVLDDIVEILTASELVG